MNSLASLARSPRAARAAAVRVLLLVGGVSLSSPAFGWGYFESQRLGAGSKPSFVTFSDLDHDGHDDLVTRNFGDSSITIWRGLGEGAFGSRSDLFLAGTSVAHAVAEFTGDAHPDLLVVDSDHDALELRAGAGDGTFAAPISYATANVPGEIAVGDFNADGRSDVAVAHYGAPVISIFLGAVGGGLLPRFDIAVLTPAFSLATADVNGDGRSDLAATFPVENLVVVWRAEPSGHFIYSQSYAVGPRPDAISAGDLNADGRLDLVVGSGNGTGGYVSITALLNDGAGFFPSRSEHQLVHNSHVEGLAVADFNQDGHLDVAASGFGYPSAGLELVLGAGDGSFATSFPALSALHPSQGFVAVGDADGDSWPDLVISDGDSGDSLTVCRNIGNHSPATHGRRLVQASGANYSNLTVGDVDRDGYQDVVLTGGFPEHLKVFFGNGSGSFRSEVVLGTDPFQTAAALADVNADGRHDLLVADYAGTVSVFRYLGSETFAPPSPFSTDPDPCAVVTGDLDRNSQPDIVTASRSTQNVCILLATAPGVFASAVSIPIGAYPEALLVRDLDGDGDLDIAVGGSNGVSVMIGDGAGQFASPIAYPAVGNPVAIAAGDFDRDGWLDMAVAGDSMVVLEGLGAGTFGPAIVYAPFWPYSLPMLGVVGADFDRDGTWDVATQEGGPLVIRTGSTDSPLHNPVAYGVNLGWYRLATADMNTDGWPDLVGIREASVSVLLNLGGPIPVGVEPQPPRISAHGPRLSLAPNPSRGMLTVRYHLGDAAAGVLELLDVSGRRVARFSRALTTGGEHAAEWALADTHEVPAGLYFARLSTPLGSVISRLVVLR